MKALCLPTKYKGGGYMRIKARKLQGLLRRKKITRTQFAAKIGVDVKEVTKMLYGEKVEVETARKFINFFGADKVQKLIDWEATGVNNPLQN
jgi:predicted transcriptional regulator